MDADTGVKNVTPHNWEVAKGSPVRGSIDTVHVRPWGLKARIASGISFEEYVYWAKVEREMEEVEYQQHIATLKSQTFFQRIKFFFTPPQSGVTGVSAELTVAPPPLHNNTRRDEPADIVGETDITDSVRPRPFQPAHDYDAEWRQASRALRTTGWINVFFLITTDLLGWSQTPFVFASAGYGIAIAGFIIFGIAAAAGGYMIWKAFMYLDSSRYPILSFGDLFFRLFGPKTRKMINVLQAFQMFCTVAVILIANSQKLSQLAHAKVCYIVIVLINVIIGALSSFLRHLKVIGLLCGCAIWINIVSFAIIIAAVATNGPNPTVVLQTTLIKHHEPVRTFVGIPPRQYQQQTISKFATVFNAIDSISSAYWGALLFVAFLAEMRRPKDFWRGMLLAQIFICAIYLFFGAFVYHFVGQYAIPAIHQIVSPHYLLVIGNILGMVIGFLVVFLYFNVGLKVVYLEVGQEMFGFPPITEKKGYIIWLAAGCAYWLLAMIIAVSVPNFAGITNLTSGLLSINFTYSIPGIMFVAYLIQSYSALPGEGYNPHTGITTRHDSGWKRYRRGTMRSLHVSVPVVLFVCCGLFCSATGTWSAIKSLEQVFGPGGTIQTFWGCTAIG